MSAVVTLHLSTKKANQHVAALEERAANLRRAAEITPPGSLERAIVNDALRATDETLAELRQELGWDAKKRLYDEWQSIDEAVAS